MKKRSKDLTEGSILKLILLFAGPILFGQFLQNLYNSADAVVVGRFVGRTALAAVTLCSDIAQFLIGFFTGLSTGAGVLFARYFGARDQKTLSAAIHTTMAFSVIIGCVLAGLGVILTSAILRILACPEDVMHEATVYMRIYLVGILFTAIYNLASGVLRAVGNSRGPFYYLAISCITNVGLDLLCVAVLKMGVAGAAIATVLSQLLSVSLIFRDMLRTQDVYQISIHNMKIDKRILGEVLRLGLPSGIQTMLVPISNVFLQRYVNLFGSAAMAGVGAAKKIDKYAAMFSNSLGLSTATFVSQNAGAGKNERTFRGIRTSLGICAVAVFLVGVPLYIFSPAFIGIFTSDAEAIKLGVSMVHTIVPFLFLQSLSHVFGNSLRGFGYSTAAMILGLSGLVGCRQLFLNASMLVNFSLENVFYAYPVGWSTYAVPSIIFYLVVIKRRFKN